MAPIDQLFPKQSERLARARADLRVGLAVRIDGPIPVLVSAIETLTPERFDALRSLGPTPHIAITHWRAEVLKARAYDGDLARIVLPRDANLAWARALADPALDLDHPMKGPFNSLRGGTADAERAGLNLAKAAHLLPAVIVVEQTEATEALVPYLTSLSQEDAGTAHSALLQDVVSARLPIAVSPQARLHVFRPNDGSEEHYAIEVGTIDRSKPVLTRLHSACFTGDVIGSLKCDCGPQLNGALEQMGAEGSGVLLYLNQEGRGIGLSNKMRAYSLQNQGFDTVEANHRLGFEDDERDFRLGAALLKALKVPQVRLLTNNPAKVAKLIDQGIEVTDRVALKPGKNPFNEAYLATKAAKSGHLL
ncbi:MAG: GTP cyclohydrolase II [Pseudomonadota bacterium]